MRAVDIIIRKRDGGTLGRDEIAFMVDGVTSGINDEATIPNTSIGNRNLLLIFITSFGKALRSP